jgi:hypothetical protein
MLQDHQLLLDYCQKFYGFGSWNSKIWFIGMEEGGKGSAAEAVIKQRLELWHKRGRKDTEAAHEFYNQLGYATEWFGSKPKLQSTWRQLIRVLLHSKKITPNKDLIRKYQSEIWGRHECEAAIFEMFALPAGSIREWLYPTFTDAPFLKSRDIYTNHLSDFRASYFQEKIRHHKPQYLVFYGTSYRNWFEKIIQGTFKPTGERGLFKTIFEKADCFLISHPTKKGITNAYFDNVGKFICDYKSLIVLSGLNLCFICGLKLV